MNARLRELVNKMCDINYRGTPVAIIAHKKVTGWNFVHVIGHKDQDGIGPDIGPNNSGKWVLFSEITGGLNKEESREFDELLMWENSQGA